MDLADNELTLTPIAGAECLHKHLSRWGSVAKMNTTPILVGLAVENKLHHSYCGSHGRW